MMGPYLDHTICLRLSISHKGYYPIIIRPFRARAVRSNIRPLIYHLRLHYTIDQLAMGINRPGDR